MRVMMKSKIHRATVTQADLDYEGRSAEIFAGLSHPFLRTRQYRPRHQSPV